MTRGWWRTGPVVLGLAVSLWTAGCTSTVDGTAVRADSAVRQSDSLLTEQDLDEILLDTGELGDLLSSPSIEVTDEIGEMTDSSADVTAPECVGALYSAEEPAYTGTGYTAVLTRLASEAGDDYQHWVEESAVIVPTAQDAEMFVERSAREWDRCAGTPVSISDGEDWFDWELSGVVRDGGIVSQVSTAMDSVEWQCEHTVAAVANVIVEASVCAERVRNEATTVINAMIAKAAER